MRAKLARLLYRLAVALDASVEPTVDLGDFGGRGRFVRNLPASQVQWGVDYVTGKYGSTEARERFARPGWYA